MRIAEFNERRFCVQTGVPLFTSLTLRFDKSTGIGTLKKHGIFTDRRSRQFLLDDVTDVSMSKVGTNRSSTYHAPIRLGANQSIRLLGRVHSEIRLVVAAIREFLGVCRLW